MRKFFDQIPILPLAVVAFFMLLAPFSPEPHILEKSRMLFNGELSKPLDIFDLFWHSIWVVLLIIRLLRNNKSAEENK